MVKWATSREELKQIWKKDQEKQGTTQALGVDWNTELGTPSMDSRDILDKTKGAATKRQLLQRLPGSRPPWLIFARLRYREDILPRNLVYGHAVGGDPAHDIGARWHA